MPAFVAVGDLIDAGRLELVSEIGKGAFGAVFCAQRVADGSLCAVKVLLPNRRTRKGKLLNIPKLFEHEATHHAAASAHPNVLSLHRAFVERGLHCLVFDLCAGGDLLSNISGRPLFWRRDDRVRAAMLQLIDGVAHVHAQGMAHRDLKPENILALDEDATQFVVSDFGLATSQVESAGFGIGSKYYKSPECSVPEEGASGYDAQVSDVWALGIILINIITGSVPWAQAHPHDEHYAAYTDDRSSLSQYLSVSPSLLPLLKRVLEPHPRARISLPDFRAAIAAAPHFHPTQDDLAHAPLLVRGMMLDRAETLRVPYALPPRAASCAREAAPAAEAAARARASDTPDESELYTPSEPAFSLRSALECAGLAKNEKVLGPSRPYPAVEVDESLPDNAARRRSLPRLLITA